VGAQYNAAVALGRKPWAGGKMVHHIPHGAAFLHRE
jgi:hypothetical protein